MALAFENSKFEEADQWINSVVALSKELGINHYIIEAEKVNSQKELIIKLNRLYDKVEEEKIPAWVNELKL